jgi:hypothetical protein
MNFNDEIVNLNCHKKASEFLLNRINDIEKTISDLNSQEKNVPAITRETLRLNQFLLNRVMKSSEKLKLNKGI